MHIARILLAALWIQYQQQPCQALSSSSSNNSPEPPANGEEQGGGGANAGTTSTITRNVTQGEEALVIKDKNGKDDDNVAALAAAVKAVDDEEDEMTRMAKQQFAQFEEMRHKYWQRTFDDIKNLADGFTGGSSKLTTTSGEGTASRLFNQWKLWLEDAVAATESPSWTWNMTMFTNKEEGGYQCNGKLWLDH